MTDLAAPEADSTWRHLPWLLSSLDAPKEAVAYLGPNWYASIMGTGIIATAGATLPFHTRGLHIFSLSVWVAAAALLTGLLMATAVHWVRHPEVARSHGYDVTMAQFYGAPPMAFMTVGAGALPVGTFVTGTTRLALQTRLAAFRWAAALAYAGLLCAWVLVAVRTTAASGRGDLFRPPPQQTSSPAGFKGDLSAAR